jgi:hypothetical protein
MVITSVCGTDNTGSIPLDPTLSVGYNRDLEQNKNNVNSPYGRNYSKTKTKIGGSR